MTQEAENAVRLGPGRWTAIVGATVGLVSVTLLIAWLTRSGETVQTIGGNAGSGDALAGVVATQESHDGVAMLVTAVILAVLALALLARAWRVARR